MPEYLAPGVYVEEIALGPPPIVGVSTSTTGLAGVARRGPVNKPVFVSNLDLYHRFFGEFLDEATFNAVQPHGRDLRWLPYAVQGFFANRGSRAFVLRVAPLGPKPGTSEWFDAHVNGDETTARTAFTVLPDRSRAAHRPLSRRADVGASEIELVDVSGLTVGTALRLGDEPNADYVQVQAFLGGGRVQVTPPLTRAHSEGATVLEVRPPAEETTLGAPPANSEGASAVRVVAGTALQADDWLRLDDGANWEAVKIGPAPTTPGPATVALVTPASLRRSHAPEVPVIRYRESTAATTTLATADVTPASTTLDLASVTGFADGNFVVLRGAAGEDEVVQLTSRPDPVGQPNRFTFAPSTRFTHAGTGATPAGVVLLEAATAGAPPPAATRLGPAAGLRLTSDMNFPDGALVIISDDVRTEFTRLGPPGAAGSERTVSPPLRFAHATASGAVRVRRIGSSSTSALQSAAKVDDSFITIAAADTANVQAGTVLELLNGASTEYAQVAKVATASGRLDLIRPLVGAHGAGTPVLALTGAIRVIAGRPEPDPERWPEPGRWGNRIRLAVTPSSRARAEIIAPVTSAGGAAAPDSIVLRTTSNIEPGTIVRFPGNQFGSVLAIGPSNKVFIENGVPAGVDVTAGDVAAPDPAKRLVTSVEFTMTVTYPAAQSLDEVFPDLSLVPAHSRYFVDIINDRSELIHVDAPLAPPPAPALPLALPLATRAWWLGGGSDGLAGITPATFAGVNAADADRRTGLAALLNVPVSIVTVPGQTDQEVQQALLNHCAGDRYRFAVLDPRKDSSLDEILLQRSLYDSKYGALYYPQIQIFDALENRRKIAPPSGHIAGIYARTDNEFGVHQAPANTLVTDAFGLESTVTKEMQDLLNPQGVNAIRAFPNRGIRVWGARTISSDNLWNLINVRRLFIFLEQSIDISLQYAPFKPNDRSLWNGLKATLTAFLLTVWRDGALQGDTPEEAFFVRAGLGETMIQADIDALRVIVLIGVAPVKPAEFVIIRIGQKPDGSLVVV